MLTLERLNKKIEGLYDQLYDQDTTLMNRVNDLFEQMSSLEATIKDQRDIIDAQDKETRGLIPEEPSTKEYEIVWQTGHTEIVTARSTGDAYTKALAGFTGSDTILYIKTSVDDMLDDDTVVGPDGVHYMWLRGV